MDTQFLKSPSTLARRHPAEMVSGMDILSHGLVSLFNGAYVAVRLMLSPAMLFLAVSGSSLAWLARLEVASLDRRAAKPEVGRH